VHTQEAELESLGRQYGLIPGQPTGTHEPAGGVGGDGQVDHQVQVQVQSSRQQLSADVPQGHTAGWPQALQQLSDYVLGCSIVEGDVQVGKEGGRGAGCDVM
jgi:hypothetical protein